MKKHWRKIGWRMNIRIRTVPIIITHFYSPLSMVGSFWMCFPFVNSVKHKKNQTDNNYYGREKYDGTAGHNYSSFLPKYIPKHITATNKIAIRALTGAENFIKNSPANDAARIIFEKSSNVFDKSNLWFSSINFIKNIITKIKNFVKSVGKVFVQFIPAVRHGVATIFSGFFRVFFTPVRVENNRTKNYYSQCSTTKKNVETKFVHLGSSSSTKYAIVNVAIQNINPPIKTPILNPCAEINCPSTNAAKVSFPTSYKFFDKLVCFIKYIIQQIKIFVKQRSGFICPAGAKRLFGVATILFLLFAFHFSFFISSAEARFLFFGKKKAEQEEMVEKKRRKPVNPVEQMEKLKSKDPNERALAVRALGQVKDKNEIDDTIKALAKALNDKDSNVRAYAVRSLGRMKSGKAIAYIKKALNDKEKSVRVEAIKALGAIGDIEAKASLKSVLKRDDSYIKILAASSLAKLGDYGNIGILLNLAQDKNAGESLRVKAILALRNYKKSLNLISVLKKLQTSKEKRIRAAADLVLRYFGEAQ